tara:strand:+ start:299 stop:601 length:303 start_codon:yes stop_codon:yes gene_type:complete
MTNNEVSVFLCGCAKSGAYNDIYNDPKAVFSNLLEQLNKSTVQRSKFVHKITGFEIFRDEVRRNPPSNLVKGDLAKYIGKKWKTFKQDVRDKYIEAALTK